MIFDEYLDGIEEVNDVEVSEEPLYKKVLLYGGTIIGGYMMASRLGLTYELNKYTKLLSNSIREAVDEFSSEKSFFNAILYADNIKQDVVKPFWELLQSRIEENKNLLMKNSLFGGKTYAEIFAENYASFERKYYSHLYKMKVSQFIAEGASQKLSEEGYLDLLHFFDKAIDFSTIDFAAIKKKLEDLGLNEDDIEDIVNRISYTMTKDFREQTLQQIHKDKILDSAIERAAFKEAGNILGYAKEKKDFFTGLRQATIEDVVREFKKGNVQINEKSIEFFEKLMKFNEDYKKLLVDKHVFVDENGNIIDLRVIPNYLKSLSKEYSNTIIAKMLHITDFMQTRDERMFEIFTRGDVVPTLSHLKGYVNKNYQLTQPVIQIGSSLYYFHDLRKPIDTGYRLISSRYGTIARATKRMFGLSSDRDLRLLGFKIKKDSKLYKILNYLDIGLQEQASQIEELVGAYKKLDDPKWLGNILREAEKGRINEEELLRIIEMYDKYTKPLPTKLWLRYLKVAKSLGGIPYDLDLLKMRTKEEIEKAAEYFLSFDAFREIRNERLAWYLRQYANDKYGFLNRTIPVSNKALSEYFKNVSVITGYDVLKREIQKEIVSSLSNDTSELIYKLLKQLKYASNKDITYFRNLVAFSKLDNKYFQYRSSATDAAKLVNFNSILVMLTQDEEIKKSLKYYSKVAAPPYQTYAFSDDTNKVNTRFMPIKKSGAYRSIKNIKEINDVTKLKAFAKQLKDEMLAGQHDPKNYTSLTATHFFFAERINELLTKAGLGLSDKSMKSPQDVWKNLFLKRILTAYLVYTGVRYIDYEVENFTGEGLFSRLYGGYANLRLGLAKLGDIFGIHSIYSYLYEISPQLQYLDENGPMSYEELKEYYASGYDPIRKGRFWGFGSSTPFKGGQIEFFRPSKYRLIKSNYLYTDVLYGSKKEYWENFWLPTPRHPFAPIRHFITDRYHWERKHYEDRPYPVTGGLFEENTPIGSILNAAIGDAIKPRIIMHKEELPGYGGIIGKINRAIKDKAKLFKKDEKGAVAIVSYDSGNLKPVRIVPASVAGEKDLNLLYLPNTEGSDVTNIVYGKDKTGVYQFDEEQNISTISSINAQIKQKGKKVKAYKKGGVLIIPSANIDYKPKKRSVFDLTEEQLSDLSNPQSLSTKLSEILYGQSELHGIFGFTAERLFENEFRKSRYKLESAGYMTSMSRQFWDLSLGGLGGNISEFLRRFLPRRDRLYKYYNPIRNKMPEWLPETFWYGDPYTKIKMGEARLPGAGYEALNKLHPDIFGKYGAFDRFKILADVAPYSEEYKIWEKIASQTITDPKLKKEMQKIRKMVAKRKQQHEFYNYRFKDLRTEKRKVTVAKVIDANTFISEELPNVPIKLAGVRLKKSVKPLSEYIQEGQTVIIEYSKDKLKRYNKDQYHTLNAIVYANGQNINRQALDEGVGTKRNDQTPVGVLATHSTLQIGLGKIFEAIAHIDNPFSNKFLRIKSPYEEYWSSEVYGKKFQTWSHPIESYIKSTFRAAFAHGMEGTIIGTIKGTWTAGLFGYLFGSIFLGGRGWQLAKITGTIGGLGAFVVSIMDKFGRTYIPKPTRQRHEIEKYFDALKYLKYKNLYEQAKRLALVKEGVYVEDIIKNNEKEARKRERIRNKLNEAKIRASLYSMNFESEEQRKEYIKRQRELLKLYTEPKTIQKGGKYTILALYYRQQMESTLVGLKKTSPWEYVFSALPRTEREYFKEFLNAPEFERKKILKIVPDYMKELLKEAWKEYEPKKKSFLRHVFEEAANQDEMQVLKYIDRVKLSIKDKVDEIKEEKLRKEKLRRIFRKYKLPGVNWEGWRPNVNLEDIKIKVMKLNNLDVSDAGYTRYDIERAMDSGVKGYNIKGTDSMVKLKLLSMLKGLNLQNIEIDIERIDKKGIEVEFDFEKISQLTEDDLYDTMFVI